MSNPGVSGDDHVTREVPVVQQEQNKGRIDQAYYRGLPGLLKLLEVGFSIVAYVSLAVSPFVCNVSTDYYFRSVSMSAFISTLIRWILLLLKIRLWMPLELGFYGIVVFLYLFADIFISIHACTGSYTASAVFGWFAIVPFSIDGFVVAKRFFDPARQSEPAPNFILCFVF